MYQFRKGANRNMRTSEKIWSSRKWGTCWAGMAKGTVSRYQRGNRRICEIW